MADFSSYGITFQNRIKPEVVAPGTEIYSSRSFPQDYNQSIPGNQSGTVYMQGTSQATPHISGLAGLLFDFFQNGKYLGKAIKCSASLLKSLLINFATVLVEHEIQPNYYAGYGVPFLLGNLPLSPDSNIGLRVLQQTIKVGSHQTIPVHIESNSSFFKATLCWIDPPLEDYKYPLVYDLDLILETPDKEFILGNNFEFHDQFNTNERVVVEDPSPVISSSCHFSSISIFHFL